MLLRALPQAGTPTMYDGGVSGGCVEQSNANAVEGMTQLVTLSREFEMITKVIEAFSNIDRKAATDIASSVKRPFPRQKRSATAPILSIE